MIIEPEKIQSNDTGFCMCEEEALDVILQENMLYRCLKCNKILKEQGDLL